MNELIYYDEITQSLSKAVKWGGENLRDVPGLLKMVLEQGMWQHRIVVMTGQEKEFNSFKEYVETPVPEGLGATMDIIKRLCKDTEVMPLLEQTVESAPSPGRPKNEEKHSIECFSGQGIKSGTSRDYTIARLKRDDPSLAQQVINREISAAEARRRAGWETRKVAVRMDDPTSAAATIVKNMPKEQIDELISLLLKAIHEL